MIICPKCKAENDEFNIRCDSCDEWLFYYEFKNQDKKANKPKENSINSDKVFLPDNLVLDTIDDSSIPDMEKILRFGEDSTLDAEKALKDAIVEFAFSPECPNCGGEIKPYEVKCRHCNIVLQDKIIQSRKLKPVWEKMFRDKLLQDGKYQDIYSDGEVKLIFKKLFSKNNKLIWYMVFILLFLIAGGAVLMYCAKNML
jgi:uncharacterized membrane protein YvbJ